MLLLLLLLAFCSPSLAIKYNPSFAGGTGCSAGVIDNNNCSIISPNTAIMPRQATNGAGGTISQ
jgi:hypothetical protein